MPNEPQHLGDLLHDEENFSDPYQVIARFFDFAGIASHRKTIITWMEAVNKNDYWRDSCPSDLLFYYKKIMALIRAAYQIYKENKRGKTASDLLKEKGYAVETNMLHPALFFGWGRYSTIWEHFPRHLNLDEYNDPYLVFPQFFAFYEPDEWQEELSELLSDALSSDNPAEIFNNDRDMLLIQKNLLKLVEAAHLIDVREVSYIGDFKKRYPFTFDAPCKDLPVTQLLKVNMKKRNKSTSSEEITPAGNSDELYVNEQNEHLEEENIDKKYHNEEENDFDKEDEDEAEEDEPVTKKKDNDDMADEALKGSAKNIRIIIRGNYVVNHPPAFPSQKE